jgi:hypothetical protein
MMMMRHKHKHVHAAKGKHDNKSQAGSTHALFRVMILTHTARTTRVARWHASRRPVSAHAHEHTVNDAPPTPGGAMQAMARQQTAGPRSDHAQMLSQGLRGAQAVGAALPSGL